MTEKASEALTRC